MLRRIRESLRQRMLRSARRPAEYWTRHNVTLNRTFTSAEESLQYFDWRNDQYFGYIDLMPVTGQDGRVVLDYGCGPGNDLVGFAVFSEPAEVIGVDVSPTSLEQARQRLALHGAAGAGVRLVQTGEEMPALPLPSGSVDYVHSSGVLHHVTDPLLVLRELRRVLKPEGEARIMVYNYDSLWLHLYVQFELMLVRGTLAGMDVRDAFARSTDGPHCPIARVYRPHEFIALAESAGFECRFEGAAVSAFEASLLPRRFDAIRQPDLAEESRRFLGQIELDRRGLPLYQGTFAGVDGVYFLRPR